MKKQRKYLISGLRPQIQKIFDVHECLSYFKDFCIESFTNENLDCILAIKTYMKTDEYEKKHRILNDIYMSYLDDYSPKTVNINLTMKKNIFQFTDLTAEAAALQQNQIGQYLDEISDELICILGWRIPHFVESKHWHEFTTKFSSLVPKCLNETDKKTWEKLRYTKKDFFRDRLSEKEIMLCEFMKDDQTIFKLERSEISGCLSIYTCDCKDILDMDDIGMGKFQGFKVDGSMPYPPWLILTALASSKFHSGIWDGYRFDREYDFKYIPSSTKNGELFYDTHIAKLIVDYGKFLDHRSCYCITENMYKGNKTYMFSKSITPHKGQYTPNFFEEDIDSDVFGEYEIHDTNLTETDPKINMKGRKKCVHMPLLSLFAIQPLGENQSLFSYSNLANPGGFLLSKLGMPQKRLLDIAASYRENIMSGIEKLLENDGYELKKMKNIYETVQTRLNRFKKTSKTQHPHIFEANFEDQIKKLV